MGFGREIKRVRDTSLPMAWRFQALVNAIEYSQPLGFHATWSYLEAKLEIPRRSPDFLLPAAERLEEVRARNAVFENEYRAIRRAEKRTGLKRPLPNATTPRWPHRWHGDEQSGAWHRLHTECSRFPAPELANHWYGGIVTSTVNRLVRQDEALSVDTRTRLRECLELADMHLRTTPWDEDPTEYRLAWQTMSLLAQIKLLVDGPLPLNARWSF